MLNIIAYIIEYPISLNQSELKSGIDPEKMNPKKAPYSVRLALAANSKRAVLKNWTMNTPSVINSVCSDSVSLPMYMINFMMKILRI